MNTISPPSNPQPTVDKSYIPNDEIQDNILLNVISVSPENFIKMISDDKKYKLVKKKNLISTLAKMKTVYCSTYQDYEGEFNCYCIERARYE